MSPITPTEKYHRVTNPERFAVLHEVAAQLLERLGRDFEVRREVGPGLDIELETACALAHPTVRLSPRNQEGAPLAVAFTSFPGLYVRFGLWHKQAFPACGCDACNEAPEDQIKELQKKVQDLVAGRFGEKIERLGSDGIWYSWRFLSISALSGKLRLDANGARRLLSRSHGSSHEWRPWMRRVSRRPPPGARL